MDGRKYEARTAADEIRLLGLAAPAVLTLLRSRESSALNKIYAEFRNQQHDLYPVVAEWCAIRDLITEFERQLIKRDSQKEIK